MQRQPTLLRCSSRPASCSRCSSLRPLPMCSSCPPWWCTYQQQGLFCEKGCTTTAVAQSHSMYASCMVIITASDHD